VTRRVLYVAHCLRPTEDEIAAIPRWEPDWDSVRREPQQRERRSGERAYLALKANLDRALRWLAWLRKSFPETTFIAPWIASVLAGADDADPAQREAGLVDACAVVERCDGIVLCGPRISSGMRRKMEHGERMNLSFQRHPVAAKFQVYSLGMDHPTLGGPPEYADGGRPTFHDWARAVEDE
jgi:hypothetical protein